MHTLLISLKHSQSAMGGLGIVQACTHNLVYVTNPLRDQNDAFFLPVILQEDNVHGAAGGIEETSSSPLFP
jgi:hypothetical protein